MFWNYLKVGLRNLYKHKTFSFINIFGLAISMCVSLLIITMLADLKQYDQFHSKKDRIFRIISKQQDEFMGLATTPFLLSESLQDDYSFVEESTRMSMGVGGDITHNQKTLSTRGFFADQSYFSIFDFEFEKGNRNTALEMPNSIVLNSKFAKKLFGNEEPLGKIVEFYDRGLLHLEISGIDKPRVSWGTFIVTGVIVDEGYKSHMKWEVMISSSTIPGLTKEERLDDFSTNWNSIWNTYTYVVLQDKKDESKLVAALNEIIEKQYIENEEFEGFQFQTQALAKVTPGKMLGNLTSFRMPVEGFYFLSFLAFIIMTLACLNYTNLSIARALTRAREVGVRKVTGANRKNLISQFMSETIIVSLFSLCIAIILLIFLKPAFMGLWINKFLIISILISAPLTYLINNLWLQNFSNKVDFGIGMILLGAFLLLVLGLLTIGTQTLRASRTNPIEILRNE